MSAFELTGIWGGVLSFEEGEILIEFQNGGFFNDFVDVKEFVDAIESDRRFWICEDNIFVSSNPDVVSFLLKGGPELKFQKQEFLAKFHN